MFKHITESLKPLFGENIFPDVADLNTPMPFCVYRLQGGESVSFLDGNVAERQQALVQFVVCTKSRLQTNKLMRELQKILCGSPLYATPSREPVSIYDETTEIRASSQEFYIWDVDE